MDVDLYGSPAFCMCVGGCGEEEKCSACVMLGKKCFGMYGILSALYWCWWQKLLTVSVWNLIGAVYILEK